MTADQLAAVVGISAGAGSFVGGWAALWWRDHIPFGHRQLVIMVYTHVDEVLGATRTENIRRADRRHKFYRRTWFVPRNLRLGIMQFFWPVPVGGVQATPALPHYRRIGHYVQLELNGDRRFRKPYQRWNIEAVTLRWTSEAYANGANFVEYLERGQPSKGGGLAQALGLDWHPGLFEVTKDTATAHIRFTRKAAAPERPTSVPVGVNADA